MTLEIISANEVLFRGEAESVTLTGVLGSFTVLKNHAPLISVLNKGEIVYKDSSDSEKTIAINGGLVDVDNNVVAVSIY